MQTIIQCISYYSKSVVYLQGVNNRLAQGLYLPFINIYMQVNVLFQLSKALYLFI